MKVFGNVVNYSKALMAGFLKPGMCVVDATCGNGNDIREMLSLMSYDGTFYAFDLQKEACDVTSNLIEDIISERDFTPKYSVINESHDRMGEYIEKNTVDLIVFNLGYLPGGDKTVTTQIDSTLRGIEISKLLLKSGGLLLVHCYPGHPNGAVEKEGLKKYFENLPQSIYDVALISFVNQKGNPPVLWVLEKK